MKSTIPHFWHLKPECIKMVPKECGQLNDFCLHYEKCFESFICKCEYEVKEQKNLKGFQKKIKNEKGLFPKKYKNGKGLYKVDSICCCYDNEDKQGDYNEIKHNLNNIFKVNFSDENFKESKASIILENNYIPKYEKMPFFVGKNLDISKVLDALSTQKYIYIYGDGINKIFIDNVIEYYKERYYLHNSNKEKNKEIEHVILKYENSENLGDIKKYSKLILFSENELKDNDIIDKYFETKINISPEPPNPKNGNKYNTNFYIKFQDKLSVRDILKIKSK